MSRVGALNAAGVLVALALSVLLAGGPRAPAREGSSSSRAAEARAPLVDATGRRFEARAHRRIASGSTVADRLLLELCDPSQGIAFTEACRVGPSAPRFGGRPTIATSAVPSSSRCASTDRRRSRKR